MGAAPRDRGHRVVGPTLAGWGGLPGIASARGLAGWEGPPGARVGAWGGDTKTGRARPPGSTQGRREGRPEHRRRGEGRVMVLGEGLLPAQGALDPDPVECPGVCILERQAGCGGGGPRKELGCPRGAPPCHCQGSQLTQPLGRGQGPTKIAVFRQPGGWAGRLQTKGLGAGAERR